MKQVKMTWKGIRPLLMHSDRLADPLDPSTKALRALTNRTAKKDMDVEEYAEKVGRVEFEGGLYFDNKLGPYIPGNTIRAVMREAGKLTKHGKSIERGLQPPDDIALNYTGPRSIKGLWEAPDRAFVDRRSIGVMGKRVIRTRPRFNSPWSIVVELEFDETILGMDQIRAIAINAGRFCGIGDGRSIGFGRFTVE